MSYNNAENVLPMELVQMIQKYVDGRYIYIPRKNENRKSWGEKTSTKKELSIRNSEIYINYLSGINTTSLAEKYFLSIKSIQRIILNEKNK